MSRRVFFVRVADRPGVLYKITSIFRRRNFNIESVAVGSTGAPDESTIIITLDLNDEEADTFARMLRRIIDVYSVEEHPDNGCVIAEPAIIRADAISDELKAKYSLNELMPGYYAYMGDPSKLENLIKELGDNRIKNIIRGGLTAMVMG